jgi:ABC-type amino acid transport substrate-binding protein
MVDSTSRRSGRTWRPRRWLALILVAVAVLVPVSAFASASPWRTSAEPVPSGTDITMLTKNIEPFIFGESGEPTGFSADLWNEIARRNGWTTTWVWTDEVADQIQQVLNGQADAAIGAISMTPERELEVDFSHRMYSSGLQIMTKPGGTSVWEAFRATVFTPELLSAFMAIAGIILVVGHIVWLSMRRREDFPKGYVRGLGQGMWLIGSSLFVASRIAVVFFQGGEPTKIVPRVLIVLWMAIAVVLVSYVNGTITATLTVSEIRNNVVEPSQLPGVRVTTVEDTQAANWLRREGIDFAPVSDVDEGIARIESGQSDAFVFDSPVLRWERSQRQGAGLEVSSELFDPVPYGIALQPGSPLREQINATMLEMLTDGTYDRFVSSYGG